MFWPALVTRRLSLVTAFFQFVEQLARGRMMRLDDEGAFEFRFGAALLVEHVVQLGEHGVMSCIGRIERDGGMQFGFGLPARLRVLCERAAVVRVIARLSGYEPHGFSEVGDGLLEIILLEGRQPALEMALRISLLRRQGCTTRLLRRARGRLCV